MKRNNKMYQDQLVLITGGSVGIGAALAQLFAQNGAHVWLLARREQYLQESLTNIISSSRNPEQRHGYVTCDVSNETEVDSAIDQVIREAGIPDILINCAGVVHPGEFLHLDHDKFHWMMDINFFGIVNVTRKILPGMIARGTGHIVNVSSMAGKYGFFGYTAYAASKSAAISFTEALRLELKPKGIKVTIVLPSDTDTEQLRNELKYRPPEVSAFNKLIIVHSPESVAKEIIAGISRNKFLILPGMDAKSFYWIVKIMGNNMLPILDWWIRRTQSKME
jgi:3-dehydrosphinganine reductase